MEEERSFSKEDYERIKKENDILKRYINSMPPEFLGLSGRDSGLQTYVCPCCQSGTGKNHTGIKINKASRTDSPKYHCFACGFSGDVISLGMEYYHTGFKETMERLKEFYDSPNLITDAERLALLPRVEYAQKEPKEYADQMDYYKEKMKLLLQDGSAGLKYMEERGISKETLAHFMIGFDDKWVCPGKEKTKAYPTPRVIIPTTKKSYLARDIRKDAPKKYSKMKYGATNLFNIKNTRKSDKKELIFVVEGEIDAMSIYEATGGKAKVIGLGSCSMWKELLREARQMSDNTFCLMLDNDNAGFKTAAELEEAFDTFGISYLEAEYPYNDPNTYLMEDREGMKETISLIYEKYHEMEMDLTEQMEY